MKKNSSLDKIINQIRKKEREIEKSNYLSIPLTVECPKCGGFNYVKFKGQDACICPSCTDGRVEVVMWRKIAGDKIQSRTVTYGDLDIEHIISKLLHQNKLTVQYNPKIRILKQSLKDKGWSL